MTFTKLISSTYKGLAKKHDERILQTFLWFPRWIGGESRWLERVKIRQIYTNWEIYGVYNCSWHNVEFITDEQK